MSAHTTLACMDAIIQADPDLAYSLIEAERESIFVISRTLAPFSASAQLRRSAVPGVQASAYQAASPSPGTGQLPAVPSSHIIDRHRGHVSPDIGVTEGWGGQLAETGAAVKQQKWSGGFLSRRMEAACVSVKI